LMTESQSDPVDFTEKMTERKNREEERKTEIPSLSFLFRFFLPFI
ncbi:mCG1034944, partial [Mus musculus]